MQSPAMSSAVRIGAIKRVIMFLTQNSSVMASVMPIWER
jgi:hypothetical protein